MIEAHRGSRTSARAFHPAVLAGMSGRDWSRPCGRICVLDLEAAPDRHAQVLARREKGVPAGSPLNEIVAASLLTFEERAMDEFSGFALRSFHHAGHTERDILENTLCELERVRAQGLLVTFNGRAFDMPMLWLRQIRWWLCSDDVVPSIEDDPERHVDVMLELSLHGAGRWPSLSDACASFGFSLHGPIPVGDDFPVPREVQKCERDVAATAMLFLHVVAAGRRSVRPLTAGMPALGGFLKQTGGSRRHLERFALNSALSAPSGPWGA